MKKLITTAALFAASTALASATEANALVHLGFDTIEDTGASLTNDGSNANATVSSSKASGEGSYRNYSTGIGTGNSIRTSSSNYLSITDSGISWSSAWTISFAVKGYTDSTNNWSNLFAIGTSADYSIRIQSNNDTERKLGIYSKNSNSDTSELFTNSKQISVSSDAFIVLTLTYDGAGAFNFYGDGELLATADTTTDALSNYGVSTLWLGGNNSSNNTFPAYYDEFTVYDAALTAEDISTYLVGKNAPLTISTIPEPSAFGLLAGVGVLALVASRRRSRKA